MPDPHATDRSAPASPLPSVADEPLLCKRCSLPVDPADCIEVRDYGYRDLSWVEHRGCPTEGEGRDERSHLREIVRSAIVACYLDNVLLDDECAQLTSALVAALGLEQVAPLDGESEPLCRLGVSR